MAKRSPPVSTKKNGSHTTPAPAPAESAPTPVPPSIAALAAAVAAGAVPAGMQFPLPMPQASQVPIPPTYHVGHIVIGMGVGELNVMVGQTRLSPMMQGPQNSATPFVEWFATMSFSAPIARQLVDGLTNALNQYEKAFGPIPKAPELPTASAQPAEAASARTRTKR